MVINMADVNKYGEWYMVDANKYGGWYMMDGNKYCEC